MHPEGIQSSMGRCPKCGMRLVPAEPSKSEPEGNQ
ncbi:MAG TPA: heavy metal-binding domain-containing protein [Candidatus Wunengus sp. YC65]